MEASAETEWPILLQHGKPPDFGAEFAGSQQNCIKIRMQLLRQNQESLRCLKHYRPYCFTSSLHTQTVVKGNHRPKIVSICPLAWCPAFLISLVLVGSSLKPAIAQAPPPASEQNSSLSQDAARAAEAWKQGDYPTAFRLYSDLAFQGNRGAEAALGIFYRSGLGVPTDYAQAMAWFQKAAAQGVPLAERFIGTMYLNGEGIVRDNDQAVAWLDKSATHGDDIAQALLGHLYLVGKQIPADSAKAQLWLTRAATQGNVDAEVAIGYMYERGLGVPPDRGAAKNWFEKAAAQGDTDAQQELGKLKNPQTAKQRNLPEALVFRCKLEVVQKTPKSVLLTETPENEKRVHDTYEACLRSNWHRLFGDTPFPGD